MKNYPKRNKKFKINDVTKNIVSFIDHWQLSGYCKIKLLQGNVQLILPNAFYWSQIEFSCW